MRKHHNLLRTALAKAKAEGLIQQNPTLEATPPRVPKPKHTRLTQEQLDAFLDTAKTHRNSRGEKTFERWHTLLYVLAYTGMRLGEALGLKWTQIDLETGMIYVTETFVERDGDEIDWGQGKSDAAQRPVKIDAETVLVLRRHMKEQEWLIRMEGERYTNMGLVFTTETGYPPNPSNLRNRVITPLCEHAKTPRITPHELRHTHATLLLKAGVNPKAVQERLGHSSIQVTYDFYSDAWPDLQKDALQQYSAKRHSTLNEKDSETG